MPTELPPQYDPHAVEARIYQQWLDAKAFHAVPEEGPPETWKRGRYSIVIPPPNVTGALHLGHAINGTVQDILARYHRMKGDNTMWMPGIDHAGIATQAVVEKTIFEREKKSRHDLGREELVRRIWEWKEQFGTRILTQLQSIGASCDWDRTRFTLDDVCAKAVREAFFKMFKDGLIFRGKRLVNWDTHLQTAVADDEIYHETVKGQMTSIRYPVDETQNAKLQTQNDGGETHSSALSPQSYLVVATTRPETMLGDTAVAVHPDDPRYQHLIGGHVIVPLVGRRIPIIADGQLVDPKFGTGVVKVTPAHDPNDYATGLRHNLEQINLLTPDGRVNENGAGEFLGKKYSYTGQKFASEARKNVLVDLEALGLIADKKPHEHEVGHSDRSKTPIEPFLSDQWFVRMGDVGETDAATRGQGDAGKGGVTLGDGTRASGLAQAAIDAVADGRVKITPERYAKGYTDWLSQKRDWCISRQLWWGHRIPVWHGTATDSDKWFIETNIPHWSDRAAEEVHRGEVEYGTSRSPADEWYAWTRAKRDPDSGEWYLWTCVAPGHADKEAQLEVLGYRQDPDVLDTWFSSALWPLSTLGWPHTELQKSEPRPSGSDRSAKHAQGSLPHGCGSDGRGSESPATGNARVSDGMAPEPTLLPYFYPTSVLSTGRDILTLWVARMVMFGLYCGGDVPFKQVYIHTTIQDGEGRPMKKTLGNGLDPVEVVASHGADAMRFTLASMSTETQDVRMPLVKDPKTGQNTSPKFDLGRNFANKIWNAARYILSNVSDDAQSSALSPQHLEDRWILSRLNAAIAAAATAIEHYRFAELADGLRSFFWTDLCDWYLEIAKARIKAGDAVVQSILLHCLRTSLQLLHPVMPFITEELWSKLPARSYGEAPDFHPGLESAAGSEAPRAGRSPSLLITAAWPEAISLGLDVSTGKDAYEDKGAAAQIAIIQSITTAIREIQNRYPAAKGKDVILQPQGAAIQSTLESSRSIIESLTNARIAENSPSAGKPENAAGAVLPEARRFSLRV